MPLSHSLALGDGIGGAPARGLFQEEIAEAFVHLITHRGFPAGLTALVIANEVFAAQEQS